MFRVLLLIFVLLSSTAYAQTEDKNLIFDASPIDEFGVAANGDIKARFDGFLVYLENQPTAQGFIVNYGWARDVARRETLIRNQINFRRYDSSRITFISGGFRNELLTQFWILPSDIKSPPLLPTAEKVDEFGALSAKNWQARFDKVLLNRQNDCADAIHIIIYAQEKVANDLEKKYLDYAVGKECGSERKITFAKGKFFKKQKTEIWIVPPGAESPIN